MFPCRPRDKRPATTNGVRDATKDLDAIRAWWRHDHRFNVGIATGAVSGLFVVDVDGLDAEVELRKLEQVHGELPATVEAITARGRHVYFQTPGERVPNSASKIAPGIDVRGDGGYVLAPPSIHPSGRGYAWSVDSTDTLTIAPDWLLAKIITLGGGKKKLPTPSSEWGALIVDGIDEGQRDNAATRLCGYLLRHYIDPILTLELLRLWNAARCRPPLPQEDIERIVASIAGKEIKRRCSHG